MASSPASAINLRPVQRLAPSAGAAAPSTDSGRELLRFLMVLSLSALPILAVLRPVTDPDIWWHLRVGQWVVEHGALPANDPFSLPGLDKPWVAYSWLYEVLVYG